MISGPADDPNSLPTVTIVRPKAQEIEKGLARLEKYLPFWKETPGLLVIKPDLGLIVSVLSSTHDNMGFLLRLAVQEKLIAPPDFDLAELDVGCGWNQPYVSFNETRLSAPYSFYLHFGSAGVARAHKLGKSPAFEDVLVGRVTRTSVPQ